MGHRGGSLGVRYHVEVSKYISVGEYCDVMMDCPYIGGISLFRSRLLSRATKIIVCKTLIRPVVSYGAGAWTLTKKEQALLIFERKIFRRIYGPKYENGEWKSRTNRELEEMNKG